VTTSSVRAAHFPTQNGSYIDVPQITLKQASTKRSLQLLILVRERPKPLPSGQLKIVSAGPQKTDVQDSPLTDLVCNLRRVSSEAGRVVPSGSAGCSTGRKP